MMMTALAFPYEDLYRRAPGTWKSTDIGLIQSGNPDVRTAGDDPYRIGQAVAVASGSTETEIEIIGGGSNAWNPGDYIHYVSGVPLVGDEEAVTRVEPGATLRRGALTTLRWRPPAARCRRRGRRSRTRADCRAGPSGRRPHTRR